jgi:hypothetical protein
MVPWSRRAASGGRFWALGVLVTGAALAAGGCGSASHSTRGTGGHSSGASLSAAVASDGGARLVPDPEESTSFPLPKGAALHSPAASPEAVAQQASVSPLAPTDAQIRAELRQMHAVLTAARAQARAAITTPQPGGYSVGGSGTISPPPGLPLVIDQVIAGGNAIADFPYVYGGGHGSFVDNAYDCSGSVSYALAAGGLLNAPETSGNLESWGVPGPGRYITVYANAGHTFMNVAGVWFDTAGRSGPYASRWLTATPSLAGYVVRHWPGL